MGVKLDDSGMVRAGSVFGSVFPRAGRRAAEEGEREAIARCPVGEGRVGTHLYETIETSNTRLRTELVAGDPSKGVNHAGYVEFGTSNMSAQPFVSPAYDVMKRTYINEIRKSLRSV